MAAIEIYVCLALLIYIGIVIHILRSTRLEGIGYRTAAHGADLAAAIEAAAHRAAIHGHIGPVGVAVGHISASEDITAAIQQVVTRSHIVKHLDIAGRNSHRVALAIGGGGGCLIVVTYMAIIDDDVGGAIYGTALTGAVGVTLYGRVSVEIGGIGAEVADNHIGLSQHVGGGSRRGHVVVAHIAAPSAAIDITHRAATDVGIGGGHEIVRIGLGHVGQEEVVHGATLAGSIDISSHMAAQQLDVRGAAYHGIGTKPATVAVAAHIAALVDIDIGVILLLDNPFIWIFLDESGIDVESQRAPLSQVVAQAVGLLALVLAISRRVIAATQHQNHAGISIADALLVPCQEGSAVEHLTLAAAAIYLI